MDESCLSHEDHSHISWRKSRFRLPDLEVNETLRSSLVHSIILDQTSMIGAHQRKECCEGMP